jgi:hypothetical protein
MGLKMAPITKNFNYDNYVIRGILNTSRSNTNTGEGKIKFTVVRMEKDMQVVIITVGLLITRIRKRRQII